MMKREEFEALGDKHKKLEGMFYNYFLPLLPIVVRLDGKAFHTFTKGLTRPADPRLQKMMVEVTKELVDRTHACIGYTQSDEISLVYPPAEEHIFGGRQSKIESTLAAIASAKFNQLLPELLPEKKDSLPTFDARAIQYPTLELAAESLMWREADATRNSLTMLCHAHFSQKQMHGAGFKAKHDMLHGIGINWSDCDVHFKRGVYVKRKKILKNISDEEWNKIPEKNRSASRICMRSCVDVIDVEPTCNMPIDYLVDLVFGTVCRGNCTTNQSGSD